MARHWTSKSERGIVLLLAVVTLLLISAVGAAILYMAMSETTFVGSQRMAARAFYAGMGGLEEARYRLLPALQPTGAPPLGLNYTDPLSMIGAGGIPIFPCTATEMANTLVPCNSIGVVAYGARPWQVLYIMNSTAVVPAPPGSDPNLPPADNNDPFVTAEVPGAIIQTTGSIQPDAGTGSSVLYQWVRINLKTERASLQDLDLNGSTADDEPVFNYLGRQYRRADLLVFDPAATVLPPPWGPQPPIDSGRNCVAAMCALPVYLVTAYATVPSRQPTDRVVRSEVSSIAGFSINAGILSQPAVTVAGTSMYIGYDQCDPDCPPGMPDGDTKKNTNPYTAFTGDPSFISNCSSVLPVQSAAATGSTFNGTSARSYPRPPGDPCPGSTAGGTLTNACITEGVPFPYDVPTLIDILRAGATPIAPGNYQGLPAGGVSIGTFPPAPYPANLINGNGAVPQVTYVGGGFKCTAGCRGSGILMIDCPTCTAAQPALTLDASMEFYGLMIVNGPVQIVGGGSAPTGCNVYGALITSGTITTDLGGAMCYRYNSCAQRDLFRNRPFGQLAFREIPY